VRSREATLLVLILIVGGLALWIDFAPDNRWLSRDVSTRLGLDLQGGTQVLLKSRDPNVLSEDMQTAETIISNRVNGLGVSEAIVQRSGSDRLIVELPGVTNPDQAIETLRSTGKLEFIDTQGQPLQEGARVRTSGNPSPSSIQSTQGLSGTSAISPTEATGPIYNSITDGKDLNSSAVQPPQVSNQPGRAGFAVPFAFLGASATKLEQFSSQNIGKPMCIVLDGVVFSCPTIQATLVGGSGEITTGTRADAERIYNQLKYGALPVTFDIESSRTVSATLGQDSVQASIIAGAVGLIVVALFMLLYYRLPGLLATVALLIYTAISFALYRLIPITLTLAGIAGFILSIGLAVDANVLIFARLKEELRRGKSLRAAVEAGFDEAWPAIRDSNASTLITSAILFIFGNSFGVSIIKGFALTLGLGILVSLFTAITVTRTFLRLIVPLRLAQNPWMYEIDEAPGLEGQREALA